MSVRIIRCNRKKSEVKEEAQKLLDQQLEQDPVFRRKYDAFLAKRAAGGKIADGDLENVSDVMPFWKHCPACERGNMIILTYGIVWMCEICHHYEFVDL